MPSLKCPDCGNSDLHAVDVEIVRPQADAPEGIAHEHKHELACKQCGWGPSKKAHPTTVISSTSLDSSN